MLKYKIRLSWATRGYSLSFRTIRINPYYATFLDSSPNDKIRMFRHCGVHLRQMLDYCEAFPKHPLLRLYLGGVVFYTIYGFYWLFKPEENPFEKEAKRAENSAQYERYMKNRKRFAEWK